MFLYENFERLFIAFLKTTAVNEHRNRLSQVDSSLNQEAVLNREEVTLIFRKRLLTF